MHPLITTFLKDDTITEIMVNGHAQIFVERAGMLSPVPDKFSSDDEVLSVIQDILKPLGRTVSAATPYADARLPDGSRVNVVIPPAAVSGPMITIRKFSGSFLRAEDLITRNAASAAMLAFLKLCVQSRRNIIISGGTGSGKTTLLNLISSFIAEGERIITIEDTAELKLAQPHVGRLEATVADANGTGAVSIRQLLVNALRMRPDRIIVGECRGGEALDMLQAMNSGHDGSISSIHANSPRDCLKRLEVMVLMAGFDLPVRAIREQIASAVNIIVQTARFADGSRKIIAISEITGMEGEMITLSPIFEFAQTGHDNGGVAAQFRATRCIPAFIPQAKARGLDVDMTIFQ